MNIFNSFNNRGDFLGIEHYQRSYRPVVLGRREEIDVFARDPFKVKSYNFRYAERPHAAQNSIPVIKLESLKRQYLNNSNRSDNKIRSAYDPYSQYTKNILDLAKGKIESTANGRLPKSKLSKECCNKHIQQQQHTRYMPPKIITKNQTLQASAMSVSSGNVQINKSFQSKLLYDKIPTTKIHPKPSSSKLSKNSVESKHSSISKLVNTGSSIKSISRTSTKTNSSSQTPTCSISLNLKSSPQDLINVSPSKRTITIKKTATTRMPFKEISPYLTNNQNINLNRLNNNNNNNNENKNRTNLLSNWNNNKKTEMIYKNPKNNIPSNHGAVDKKFLSANNRNENPLKSKFSPTVRNRLGNRNKENSTFLNFEMSIELIH